MTDQEILEKLTDIFRDILDDDNIVLTPETTAEDITDWDSANHVNIVVSTEMRFKVRFSGAEVEHLKNVGDFVKLVQRKMGG